MTDEQKAPTPANDAPLVAGESSVESEYKVGPGHPPKEYRWKPGCPSPHPAGRKRKIASVLPDLKKIFEAEISKKVKAKQNGKDVQLSKLALGIVKLVNSFAQGDRHARKDFMEMAKVLGVDLAGHKREFEDALLPGHQAIVDAFLSRQTIVPPAPPQRVIAPIELCDGARSREIVTRRISPPPK
jgi:uncharacterized protein DUF5681